MKAALLFAFVAAACRPNATEPTPRPEVSTDTARSPALGPAVSGTASTSKLQPAVDDSCEPDMFMDNKPGAHGLHVFEDPSGQFGYRDAAGKTLIAPRFLFAYEFGAGGIAAVMDPSGPAFIGTDGRIVARAFLYDNGPDYFVAGRARIVANGKVGFIDDQGRIVVPPQYDHASAFCGGRAAVCNGCTIVRHGEHAEVVGGAWGSIDREGKVVEPLHVRPPP